MLLRKVKRTERAGKTRKKHRLIHWEEKTKNKTKISSAKVEALEYEAIFPLGSFIMHLSIVNDPQYIFFKKPPGNLILLTKCGRWQCRHWQHKQDF